ncbi:hypothetical protein TKK_0012683 [Trichogramma kaykai]
MHQSHKRIRAEADTLHGDLFKTLDKLSDTINSIGKTQQSILKSNDYLVKYMLASEEAKKTEKYHLEKVADLSLTKNSTK